MKYLMMAAAAFLLFGCSFNAQPQHQAVIVIAQKKSDNATLKSSVSLNQLVAKDDLQKMFKFGEVELIPTFVIRDQDKDHYRIKYTGPDESRLLEIKYDGKGKMEVWESLTYSVYITPPDWKEKSDE